MFICKSREITSHLFQQMADNHMNNNNNIFFSNFQETQMLCVIKEKLLKNDMRNNKIASKLGEFDGWGKKTEAR